MHTKSALKTLGRGRLLLAALLLAAVGIAGALLTTPEPARARKGYGGGGYGGGGYGYTPCNQACHVGKCRKQCGKTKRTCVFCAREDKKAAGATCTQTASQSAAACSGDRACKVEVRKSLKACKGQLKQRYSEEKANCAGLTGSCKGCCGENYAGACPGVFRGTDGYGTSFHSYGGKNYRPDCSVNGDSGPAPGPGDPACQRFCERARLQALSACGEGKRAIPDCVQQVEAAYQACLAQCGGNASTTSTSAPAPGTTTTSTFIFFPGVTTTTTTTFPPASSRGAFLD